MMAVNPDFILKRYLTGMVLAIVFAKVPGQRLLSVARSVPAERSGVSTERDAGSHSVDRIVRSSSFNFHGSTK